MSKTLILTRVSALILGAAAAAVGMYASYEAAAQADGGYLMLAAPIVALAAALTPAYAETALHARQYLKGVVLILVWLPCFATVVSTAIERNHLAKAGGEAQRASMHTAADRAHTEVTEAKAALAAATTEANKTRGMDAAKCKKTCLSARATETAARTRVEAAMTALTAAEGKAVTEASIKAPDWLLPVALEIVSMALIWVGFTLGRGHVASAQPVQVPVVPATPVRTKDPKKVAAGKKAAATVRAKKAALANAQAAGKVIVAKKTK